MGIESKLPNQWFRHHEVHNLLANWKSIVSFFMGHPVYISLMIYKTSNNNSWKVYLKAPPTKKYLQVSHVLQWDNSTLTLILQPPRHKCVLHTLESIVSGTSYMKSIFKSCFLYKYNFFDNGDLHLRSPRGKTPETHQLSSSHSHVFYINIISCQWGPALEIPKTHQLRSSHIVYIFQHITGKSIYSQPPMGITAELPISNFGLGEL